ncbi:PQQ-binding-like beta-propeller repeat protein [Paenibacillus sp. LMG 31459]|uniref:PQQ-binding-like beta-propeller repeat protein n=1 Tax=Paenibacillus phytohabitans TaxID=2654978 RepID=A0ABX1YDF1_9BACL|nr:PQQ-binding-like beta-propeller repeat protein [Paenibacillus phytohabitans]NOU78216.1 PQQ-binding-like beta-propeller repeat protein [Paenibacillus phytohabitans]
MRKGIIRLGLISLILLCTMGATVVKNPLEVTQKLYVKNDQGNNIILKNATEYEMKWFITDKSPFQQYNLYRGPDGLIYAQSFEEIIAINANSGKFSWRLPSDWQGNLGSMLGADGTYYNLNYDDVKHLSSTVYQADVMRFSSSGEATTMKNIKLQIKTFFEDGALFDFYHAGDSKGNYIVLTDKGLQSIGKDGSTNWLLTTISLKDRTLDFNDIGALNADSNGHVIVDFTDAQAILDTSGNIIRVEDYSEIKAKPVNYSDVGDKDGHGGYYILNDRTNTLQDLDFKTRKPKWSYSLNQYEKAAGIGFFSRSFATDIKGNVYFGANNGNVYSLDYTGKPRFTLSVGSRSLSYPDILSVNDNLTVISVNNNIICLQKKSK